MRIRILFFTVCLIIFRIPSYAQEVAGCMDPLAINYNAPATINDGSCSYSPTSATLVQKGIFNNELKEISGMVHINGKLYAINDGGNDNSLYVIDTLTGAVEKIVTLEGATNKDWEDITADGTYIYIGDFGNNAHGNRTDLKFYRVPLQSINGIAQPAGTIPEDDIDIIYFSYEDQTDFSSQSGNHTAFDCESVLYDNGKLHFFTKNWIGNTTSHYTVPAQPGEYIAEELETFDTGGILITGAAKTNNNIVMLLGYKLGGNYPCTLWMISGYSEMDQLFTTGNKRKIDLGSAVSIGQVESITAVKPTRVLISNEYTYKEIFPPLPPIEIQPTLYALNSDKWTPEFVLPFSITDFTVHYYNNQSTLSWVYPNQDLVLFEVESSDKANGIYHTVGKVYCIDNPSGQFNFSDPKLLFSGSRFYRIKLISPDGKMRYSKTLSVSNDGTVQSDLLVKPNPFREKIEIRFFSQKWQIVQFSIMDVHGRVVLKRQIQCTPGSYDFLIDGLQGLPQGYYFLKTQTPGQVFVNKLLR